jgi:cation diffusion facilitator family transporter
MTAETRARAVTRVYSISLLANLIMLSLKLSVGFVTGSLVMLADGVDSSLDAVANIIAMIVTRLAGRPPDEDHPYGHRRYETLGALMIGAFLLITASEIVKSAVSRLLSGETPHIGLNNFAVMILALAVNIGLFVLQHRAGRRLRSEVLTASSEDKRSDIMVSVTVLLSLVTVRLGVGWIDAAAALVVVALICRNAFHIMKHAAGVLVDHVALDAQTVTEIVISVPSVRHVFEVRSRGTEDDVHLDLLVSVAAPTTIDHSAAIADEISRRLRDRFEGLSIIDINFVPEHDLTPDYTQIAQTEAAALGLSVHEIAIAKVDDHITLDGHVEVGADQTLENAHAIVSRFEERLMEAIPELAEVNTHIEPLYGEKEFPTLNGDIEDMKRAVMRLVTRYDPQNYWHELNIREEADGSYTLTIHCQLEGSMLVDEAHDLAERIETRLRAELPQIHRVTIHTEPFERAASGPVAENPRL